MKFCLTSVLFIIKDPLFFSAKVGLPACSWAATLVATLMLLLTGSLAAYRIPIGQVRAPERNLQLRSQWEAGNTEERESADEHKGS